MLIQGYRAGTLVVLTGDLSSLKVSFVLVDGVSAQVYVKSRICMTERFVAMFLILKDENMYKTLLMS